MYESPLYQNSVCKGGWLHRYIIKRSYKNAVEEICAICKDRKIFSQDTPNRIYLSYHLRESLQPSRGLIFQREYPQYEK